MTRFVRRTFAPLLAGGLVAGVLVGAAADALPFNGVLAQATDEPDTTDTTVPLAELDLDTLVEQPSTFDPASVFIDLDEVGDFDGIYDYAGETATRSLAPELELIVTDEVDPDGDGPIVTTAHAATNYLLDDQCSALLALAYRRQHTRTVVARILRPDVGAATAPVTTTTTAPSSTATASAAETDPLGITHTLPLESVVEVATITVSELDFDLVRARPANLLADLVSDNTTLRNLAGGQPVTGDVVGTPEFYEAAWTACLGEAAEEGTVPVPQTLAGQPVWSLAQDHPPSVSVAALTPDIDTVAWLEDGLDVRVESTFFNVDDNLRVDLNVDFDTKTWLTLFADSVEPATEIAAHLAGRKASELDVLEQEAFESLPGFEYGERLAGAHQRVGERLRPAAPAEAATPADAATTGVQAPADAIRRVTARAVFPPGANLTTTRRRLSNPPNGFGVAAVGVVQAVIWDPAYLNSDPFRDGWKRGLEESAATTVDLDDLEVATDGAVDVGSLGVVDMVLSQAEGVWRVDYLMPCYSVTVSALDEATARRVSGLSVRSQRDARTRVFGVSAASVEPAVDTDDPFSPSLDDLDLDYVIAALEGRAQHLEEQREAARAERAKGDAYRTALCSAANLTAHFTGYAVTNTDGNGNGIADELPENAVPTT